MTLVPGWTRGCAACLKLTLHQVHVALGVQADLGRPLVRHHDDRQVGVRADDVGEWFNSLLLSPPRFKKMFIEKIPLLFPHYLYST